MNLRAGHFGALQEFWEEGQYDLACHRVYGVHISGKNK